jgi:hypothetical protein
MPTHTVTWTIDVDAEDPRHAIRVAKEILTDRDSSANVFSVQPEGKKKITIDLGDEDNYAGRAVLTRDGAVRGIASGATRKCMLEGCPSQRIRVNWPDGTFSFPCARGLKSHPSGDLQIE